MSSNNLSSIISLSTQLQTKDAAAYIGNPQLFGDPLPKKCPNEKEPTISSEAAEDGDEGEFITTGLYISVPPRFVVGFWGIFGTLIKR